MKTSRFTDVQNTLRADSLRSDGNLDVAGNARVDNLLSAQRLVIDSMKAVGMVADNGNIGTLHATSLHADSIMVTWLNSGTLLQNGLPVIGSPWVKTGNDIYYPATGGSGNVGIGTSTPGFKLTLDNDGGIIAKGAIGQGAVLSPPGTGARLIWYPRKAAFRAGRVVGDEWDDSNVGLYSTVLGLGTATGEFSIATGFGSLASGFSSTATGSGSIASGAASTAMGSGSQASGVFSMATGNFSTASGINSLAMIRASAAGNSSAAIGDSAAAIADNSIAVGYVAVSQQPYSFTIGRRITNNTSSSLMVGFNTGGAQTTVPTLFVGPAFGTEPAGNVGIGTSNPTEKLTVAGNVKVSGKTEMQRITSPDSIVRFGDSTIWIAYNSNRILAFPVSALVQGLAIGNFSSGAGLHSLAIGRHAVTTVNATNSIAMGSGAGQIPMVLNQANSLGIGFNSDIPTLYVGPSSGLGTTGSVGIGTTSPVSKLHIRNTQATGLPTLPEDFVVVENGGQFSNINLIANFKPSLLFSSFTTRAVGFVRSNNALGGMEFGTDSTVHMVLTQTGELGIGTTAPGTQLEIKNPANGAGPLLLSTPSPDIYFETGPTHFNWRMAVQEDVDAGLSIGSGQTDDNALDDSYTTHFTIKQNGSVGIGTTNPQRKLHVVGQTVVGDYSAGTVFLGSNGNGVAFMELRQQNGALQTPYIDFINDPSTDFDARIILENDNLLRISGPNLKVNIGGHTITSGPHTDYKLSVDGKIVARSYKATDGPEWGDYVLKPDFPIETPAELESFYLKFGFLPGFPSAKEVEENGLDLVEIDNAQQVQIEKNVWYIVEQDKRITQLEKENEEYKQTILYLLERQKKIESRMQMTEQRKR